MASLHDSLLVGYAVDGHQRTIVLRTERYRGGGTAADVKFSGVAAYHLEGDCLQNILHEIAEVSFEAVVGDGHVFAERHRQFGWPAEWDSRRESAEQFLRRRGCRCFELKSSYGICGWIACERMDVLPEAHSN